MLDAETAAPPPWGAYPPSLPARALIQASRNSLLGRGLLRKRLAQLFSLLHSGPVDAWLWGQKVRLFPDNNVCERKALLRPDRMDRHELAFLRAQMRRPRPVFVDVGANAGLYSLYAALHMREGGRILAIEPDAAILSRFEFNLRLAAVNRTSIAVATAGVAVGDHNGEALLATHGDEGSRSLRAGVGRPVKLRRLAGLLNEHAISKITVMKIDVEGYEDRVLPPYLAEVGEHRWPHAIMIEHVYRASWNIDCVALCQSSGYRVCAVTRNNTLLERAG